MGMNSDDQICTSLIYLVEDVDYKSRWKKSGIIKKDETLEKEVYKKEQ